MERAVEEGWTAAQVRQEVRRIRAEQTPPLPAGQYDVILADPPWRYDNTMTGAARSMVPLRMLADPPG